MTVQHPIRSVMRTSSDDAAILELWLNRQPSPLTRACYRRDALRLFAHTRKPLNRMGLPDLQSFAESLIAADLAPISRARTLAAVRSLFGFCQRMRYLPGEPGYRVGLAQVSQPALRANPRRV